MRECEDPISHPERWGFVLFGASEGRMENRGSISMLTKNMKGHMKFIHIVSIVLVLVWSRSYALDLLSLSTKPQSPKYELITAVYVGPLGHDEKKPTAFPYRYRAVVSTFETYDYLYIEKLKTNNEQGITQGIEWARRVYLPSLLENLRIPSEQQNIGMIKWQTPKSFCFEMGGYRISVQDVSSEVLNVRPSR